MSDRVLKIASRIRNARQMANLNQKQLADKMGISQTRLSNWEKGTSRPLADNIFELSDILGVSSDFLLGLSDDPNQVAFKHAAYGVDVNNLPKEALDEIDKYIELQKIKHNMKP